MMELRKLKTASYYATTRFGDFPTFFREIAKEDYLIDPIKKFLYNREINNLESILKTPELSFLEMPYLSENYFLNQYQIIIQLFNEIFKGLTYPPLHLVDKFPEPFTNREWDAMSIDKNDEIQFKIPHGIYFKKQYLTHPYFEYIITHELVHWIISEYSNSYKPYVSMHEEGFCDFFTIYLLIYAELLPKKTISNLLAYNRTTKDKNSLWFQYWKSSQWVLNGFIDNGIESIIDAIKSGRSYINNLSFDKINADTEIKGYSKIEHSVISVFASAHRVNTLPIEEFFLLEKIIEKCQGEFNKSSLFNLELSDEKLDCLLLSLVKRGFIIKEKLDGVYFNPLNLFPESIKFLSNE